MTNIFIDNKLYTVKVRGSRITHLLQDKKGRVLTWNRTGAETVASLHQRLFNYTAIVEVYQQPAQVFGNLVA